jgi:hypothetical protein
LRIPGFTEGNDGRPSMLRRQCTREFKIAPIEKRGRALLGFKARQRIPARSAHALIGISRDEIQRVKDSFTPWVLNRYPLIDAGLYRGNCLEIVKRAGLPAPRKSACVFCPYHDDAYWRELRAESPAEFEAAAVYDERVRDSSQAGVNAPRLPAPQPQGTARGGPVSGRHAAARLRLPERVRGHVRSLAPAGSQPLLSTPIAPPFAHSGGDAQ